MGRFMSYWVVIYVNGLARSSLAVNVLFLLADDGGFELGVYRNRIVQTPNIDALAKNSLIFNQAHTSVSSCSPSRAALLSGIPSHQNGMYGLHHGVHHFSSLDSVTTLTSILSKNQIYTGIIGKKHVGPENVYPFDFAHTEQTHESILQVGRNITNIKLLTREFLKEARKKQFFLYIGFHDPHRCGHTHPEYGSFCEKFGDGDEGHGVIPDWTPVVYRPEDVFVPYFIQDTQAAREDIAAQYTTISRLDAGVGLVLEELRVTDVLKNTLIIYTSDNGIPFAAGRTNLYDSGSAVPLLIASPETSARKYEVTNYLTSLVDLVPTIIDWYGLLDSCGVKFPGNSLLPLLQKEKPQSKAKIFYSHNLHEVTMYYPMRAIRTKRYKLIHNLNFNSPFPIDQDLYVSPSFQDLLNRTKQGQTKFWYRSLKHYAHRPEWELFDMKHDPEEVDNLVFTPKYKDILQGLKTDLWLWQKNSSDPWLCSPNGILEHDECMSL